MLPHSSSLRAERSNPENEKCAFKVIHVYNVFRVSPIFKIVFPYLPGTQGGGFTNLTLEEKAFASTLTNLELGLNSTMCSSSHSQKHIAPISSTLAGMRTEFRLEQ
jgi:hypothetical protein